MKISYRITEDTFVKAQKLHAAKGAPFSQRILKFVFPPFFLLIGAVSFVLGSFGPTSLIMPLLGTFYTVLFWVYPPWQWKRKYAKESRLHGEYIAHISEEGIRLEGLMADGNMIGVSTPVFSNQTGFSFCINLRNYSTCFPKALSLPARRTSSVNC